MKSVRDIRVIPIVLVAIFGLAVLKLAGLVIDGGYVFDYQPQSKKQSWAQEMFNFPGRPKRDLADITGSVDKPPEKAAEKDAAKPAVAPPETKPDGMVFHPRRTGKRFRPPSGRYLSGCSRAGKSSRRARAKSISAKVCSKPRRSGSKHASRM